MRIKKATLKDFDQIFPLLVQLWSTVKISQDEAFFVYRKLLRDKQVGLAVVVEDKKIIGFASYRWKWDLWTQGKVAHMDEIIIDQKYRSRGIGKKLATILLFVKVHLKGKKLIHFTRIWVGKNMDMLSKKLGEINFIFLSRTYPISALWCP